MSASFLKVSHTLKNNSFSMVQSKEEQQEFLRQLGEYIVLLRKQQQLKQIDLADLLDMDVRVLRRIEKGETNIQILLVFQLAKVLNVQPESFITLSKD
ncbi:helix-turn-helix domain-containing protein [Kordia jejudonensis]|uniref:helix-turn-helix domain-containing protein n=1 Tax=Kordia jejudonensis TaxID=1348245 RepID=UPI00138E2088|nr:helix-turn-helix transcriptional regulator [Kordia jejudonensis]